MSASPRILGHDGKPIHHGVGMNTYLNSGLSNGAASLNDPSLTTWEWAGGDSDADIVANLDIVRQRVRDLCLNAPIVAGLVNTIVTSVVGQGLIPEPTPDAELLGMDTQEAAAFKRRVLRYWEAWAENAKACDVRGVNNFYEQTRMVLRGEVESGDIFATLPYVATPGGVLDLKVQLIEADCISNPSIADISAVEGDVFGGVETGEYGDVLAYWVATRHPLARRYPFMVGGKHPHVREWVRVPVYGQDSRRRNALHIMRSLRPNQRRGVSILAPIVKASKKLDRFLDAELQASLVNAMFTMAVKSDMPEQTAGEWSSLASQWGEGDYTTPSQRFYEQNGMVQMGAGTVTFLAPGDSIEPVGVQHPNSGFDTFVASQLKMMGASVGVPFELLTMTFNASFSASKAALSMATAGFKVQRDHIVETFCQPVFDAFMTECVAAGYINAPGFWTDPLLRQAYCMTKWSGPGALQIDPGKEVDAAIKRASVGISTLQQETTELTGGDWLQNSAIRHNEQQVFDAAPWDTTMTKASAGTANEEGEPSKDESSPPPLDQRSKGKDKVTRKFWRQCLALVGRSQ